MLTVRHAQGDEAPKNAAPACPEGDATACGRAQFEAGTRAFERGDYEGAARAFQSALALRPHPVIRYNLGLCWARLTKPTLAIRELNLVLADPQSDKELRARSARELRSAEQALSHVTFTLSDPARDRLELDGAVVASESHELALDPSSHHVRILSGASVVLDQDLDLAPGERVELRVGQRSRRIDVVVVADAASRRATPSPPTTVAERPRHGLSPGWFFAAAGTTAVLTGLTVWSGLDTQSALSEYEKLLPTSTQAEADRRVSDGHARELRTNLLLTGTLIAAASSTALAFWFVDFGGSQPATVALGAGQLSLSGRF
jgi:tetratricopeptide (TPR) repeat protein